MARWVPTALPEVQQYPLLSGQIPSLRATLRSAENRCPILYIVLFEKKIPLHFPLPGILLVPFLSPNSYILLLGTSFGHHILWKTTLTPALHSPPRREEGWGSSSACPSCARFSDTQVDRTCLLHLIIHPSIHEFHEMGPQVRYLGFCSHGFIS